MNNFKKYTDEKAFIAKLSDSEGEAAETQPWLDFAHDCGYINVEICSKYNREYEYVLGMIVNMIKTTEKWSI